MRSSLARTKPRIGIVSPDPNDDRQGVERFCHSLSKALNQRQFVTEVIPVSGARRDDFDLILTNSIHGVRTRVPRIHVFHGCAVPQIYRSHAEASLRWRAKFMAEASWREFRGGLGATRVSVANRCAREVRRWYGFKSRVIPNGIDTGVFKAMSKDAALETLGKELGAKSALFIGRPEWRKRPDIALQAATESGYRVFLASGRAFEGMTWLGSLDQTKLAAAIASADVVLMPAQYEACSLALLEALAVGTPVVTSDAGWVPDLVAAVPNYASLVAPVGDSAAFARALKFVDENPEAAASIAKDASEFVRSNNSLDNFGDDWAKMINGILDQERPEVSLDRKGRGGSDE
jgi:glycosyltransferase involved in cell wall biosynthesis